MNRTQIADLIVARLDLVTPEATAEFRRLDRIHSAVIEDLLPSDLAKDIYASFPPADRMMLKKSIKEHKLVAVQMDAYNPLLEEIVFAFQDVRVVKAI